MKKLFTMLEDLWIAVAFAEAGIYDPAVIQDPLHQSHDTVEVLTA